MTDDSIEAKALALLNEVNTERNMGLYRSINRKFVDNEALCRAIEKHEAFRQEVSDVVEQYVYASGKEGVDEWVNLKSFIIPKPKPDPLEEVLYGVWFSDPKEDAKALRAALEARGLEIREKNDG